MLSYLIGMVFGVENYMNLRIYKIYAIVKTQKLKTNF